MSGLPFSGLLRICHRLGEPFSFFSVLGALGPPARCPLTNFFGWEGSPTKKDDGKKKTGWYPYSNLLSLEDLVLLV